MWIQTIPGGTEEFHQFLDVITPVALGAVFVAGLMLRSAMAEAATKHVQAAAEVKAELVAQNAKLASELAVHTAEDRLQFGQLQEGQETLQGHAEKIEAKIDILQRTKT